MTEIVLNPEKVRVFARVQRIVYVLGVKVLGFFTEGSTECLPQLKLP